MRAQIFCLSFSVAPGTAACISLTHEYPSAPEQLPLEAMLARLKPWLETPAQAKLGQNVKYDPCVRQPRDEVRGYRHDTLLQSYVLEVHKPHGLASLAERHVGRSGIHCEDLCGKGTSQIKFNQVGNRGASRTGV